MIPSRLAALASAVAVAFVAPAAAAQAAPTGEGLIYGGFTFKPTLEVRVRGEYWRHPIDVGGPPYATSAVLGAAADASAAAAPLATNLALVGERSRLGLTADRGPVTLAFTLQDARVLGSTALSYGGPGEPALPSLQPLDAYIDLHGKGARHTFLRLGRQRVTWGEGRLVGEDDWSPTARALDAARFGFQVWDIDVELMAAMLSAPGDLPVAAGSTETPTVGSGAQLYGADVVWHLFPLLQIEATGLARVVRSPTVATLTPGDTLVLDGRLSGDRAGIKYALEGAYEGGNVAIAGGQRKLAAYALDGRASYELPLFWHLTVGALGAYATGDDGSPAATGTFKRFDPILANQHGDLSPMSAFAWSNAAILGGTISGQPLDYASFELGYRHASLAEAKGRWTDGALAPVGASAANTSKDLGHELDVALKIAPWTPLEFQTGYSVFLHGDGARRVLVDSGRGSKVDHWVYLQAEVHAP